MKWLLTIAGLVSFGVGLSAGWHDRLAVLVAGALGGAFLLFVANLDRISEFKATRSGIEARTREVLKKAEHTVSELQILARIVGEVALSLVKRSGRLGGYEDDEAERIKSGVLSALKEIGVTEEEFDDVLRDWHRLTQFDYVLYILGHSTVPRGFDDHRVIKEWKALRSFESLSTPGQVRAFLKEWRLLTDERAEYLRDFEHYVERKEHRRPDVWKNRESWPKLENPDK
jgi:hypothetical protein